MCHSFLLESNRRSPAPRAQHWQHFLGITPLQEPATAALLTAQCVLQQASWQTGAQAPPVLAVDVLEGGCPDTGYVQLQMCIARRQHYKYQRRCTATQCSMQHAVAQLSLCTGMHACSRKNEKFSLWLHIIESGLSGAVTGFSSRCTPYRRTT